MRTLVEINNDYKNELFLSLHNNRIHLFEADIIQRMENLVLFLKLVNNLNSVLVFHCYLCFCLLIQIDLYNKYSFVTHMALLLENH